MSNKKAKQELIRLYGKECFIEKLKLRKDTTPRRYTSKGQRARMKQLTYHHIRMKKDGGHATRQNGALLSAENQVWFHKQPSQAQVEMNQLFQEYKRQVDECKVVFVDELDLDFQIKVMEFSLDDLTQKKSKYNRAKEKREFQKLVDKELEK